MDNCNFCSPPAGMSRRHFMRHLAGAAAFTMPAFAFARTLRAHAQTLSKNHKSAILLWLGGGAPTIDMWDLKTGAPTAGPMKPISTAGDFQICEKLPKLALQMKHLSVVRSMSTREADHERGRYYMHTGFVPNPSVDHPSYGAVVAHEMEKLLMAGLFGDGVCAVSGGCEWEGAECRDECAAAADGGAAEAAECARDAVH
jgi:hypothetical protein